MTVQPAPRSAASVAGQMLVYGVLTRATRFQFLTDSPHSPLEVEHVGRLDFTRPGDPIDMDADVWAIRWSGRCWGRSGEWAFEPQPSSSERMGSDGGAWLAEYRWKLDEALHEAVRLAGSWPR